MRIVFGVELPDQHPIGSGPVELSGSEGVVFWPVEPWLLLRCDPSLLSK